MLIKRYAQVSVVIRNVSGDIRTCLFILCDYKDRFVVRGGAVFFVDVFSDLIQKN